MTDRPNTPITYFRIAAAAFPFLVVAVAWLVYRDLDRVAHEPVAAPAASASVVAPSTSASARVVEPTPSAAASQVFDGIYRNATWGQNDAGEGTSGYGSTLESTEAYRHYLQAFMKEHHIKSVVDAGCGDWEFSKAIDWTGIDYKGYDVVASVIEKDKARYGGKNVQFFVANVVTDELPSADLYLSKHVLQHLPNADVQKVIEKLLKYRHVLLTNSVSPTTLSGDNRDIAIGAFRYLDPTRPPFQLPGVKVLSWWDGHVMHQTVHLERRDARP